MADQIVRLTRHARNRLRLWQLTEADVTTAVTQPDSVTSSERGRKNAWKHTSGRWLRVTYIQEDGTIVIITATLRRGGPEEE